MVCELKTIYVEQVLTVQSNVGSSEAIDIDGRVVNGVEATDFIPYQCSVRVAIRDYARFGRGE